MFRFVIVVVWREMRPVVIALAILVVLLVTFWKKDLHEMLDLLREHGSLVFILITISIFMALYRADKPILLTLKLFDETSKRLRAPLRQYLFNELLDIGNLWKAITSGGSFGVSRETLEKFVDAWFHANRGRHYFGTDSNTPSRFKEYYPTYLEKHLGAEQASDLNAGIRVLLVDKTTLLSEYGAKNTKDDVVDFITVHKRQNIRLLQVEVSDAAAVANRVKYTTGDIGVFDGRYVVFFRPMANQSIPPHQPHEARIDVAIKTLEEAEIDNLRTFASELNRKATVVVLTNERLEFRQRTAAQESADLERMLYGLNARGTT